MTNAGQLLAAGEAIIAGAPSLDALKTGVKTSEFAPVLAKCGYVDIRARGEGK